LLLEGLLTLSAIEGLGGADSNTMDDEDYASAQKKGVAYVYFLFGFICAVCLVFLKLFVPETQGMSNL
jgi:hypothetical protein